MHLSNINVLRCTIQTSKIGMLQCFWQFFSECALNKCSHTGIYIHTYKMKTILPEAPVYHRGVPCREVPERQDHRTSIHHEPPYLDILQTHLHTSGNWTTTHKTQPSNNTSWHNYKMIKTDNTNNKVRYTSSHLYSPSYKDALGSELQGEPSEGHHLCLHCRFDLWLWIPACKADAM